MEYRNKENYSLSLGEESQLAHLSEFFPYRNQRCNGIPETESSNFLISRTNVLEVAS